MATDTFKTILLRTRIEKVFNKAMKTSKEKNRSRNPKDLSSDEPMDISKKSVETLISRVLDKKLATQKQQSNIGKNVSSGQQKPTTKSTQSRPKKKVKKQRLTANPSGRMGSTKAPKNVLKTDHESLPQSQRPLQAKERPKQSKRNKTT